MKHKITHLPLLAVIGCLSTGAYAAITPANLFSDEAVFQQGVHLPVWGTATADEKQIIVNYRGQTQISDIIDGKWRVDLEPLPASAKAATMTIQGRESRIAIDNTLVGEVWLASGQSNMEFGMNMFAKSNPEIRKDIDQADDPLFRIIKVRKEAFHGEIGRNKSDWITCSPATARGFSATAYYFARELRKQKGVPVGIILCAWSGSAIETWIPQNKLSDDPDLQPIIEQYKTEVSKYTPQAYENLVMEAIREQNAYDNRRDSGIERSQLGPRPKIPMGPKCPTRPGSHYDVMLRPLIPYAIKGVIWYQGETNGNQMDFRRGGPYLYRKLLATMIKTWRGDWHDDTLPFIFVQLPSWKGKTLEGNEAYQGWAELRDSQLQVFSETGHTGMAVTMDLGDFDDIHPWNKEAVGMRLALCAQQIAYGDAYRFSAGPVAKSYHIDNDSIRITFDYADTGLVLNPENHGFLICGPDRVFVPAKAICVENTVKVWSDDVPDPIAVRYGWSNAFEPALLDKNGLPASPFRTDNFKLISQQ
ncbi:sialate O-acetylesterase [Pelagicoccus sp. SDUM812005]|uniref:sialate O-acetylesterase n=1 Tax=Pelagicoccus sp. SDUM812005 TaxID=3041257 RepID=UPI00280E0BB0|nr:sialate O-acetylesterase [Pelagicoccus sp. SDUM812005]MDQ8183783.1 sialate O-acetylesterase [Pelagicoccus sp. SDUM812005]